MTEKAKIVLADALDCAVDDIQDGWTRGTGRWDSLAHVRLMLILESEYNFVINDDNFETVNTVSDIQVAIEEQ
jgi:acyl carrier protein